MVQRVRAWTKKEMRYCRMGEFINYSIKRKMRAYLSQNPCISFALLFGSWVKGKGHAFSDIDIGVYFSKPISLFEFGILVCDLEKLTRKKIDLVELNSLYERDIQFAYQVVTSSEILVCKDKSTWVNYKTKVILDYFDIKELLDQIETRFRQRLEENKFGIYNYA